MTELAVRNGHTPTAYEPEPADTDTPGSDLVAWAQSAVAANNIAQSLARTCFVPKAFQGKPDDVTAAILAGNEMGLSPMAALRSINVIQGSPSLNAVSLRGLAQSKGHELWTEESTASRAIVCGRRKGSEKVERVIWTMDRATKAGFVSKNPNYKSQPQSMLLARATAECARLVAADALLGMPYSSEELADEAGDTPKPRKVSRKKPEPVATPEPELEAPQPERATDDGPAEEPPLDQDDNDGALWPPAAQPGSGTPTT